MDNKKKKQQQKKKSKFDIKKAGLDIDKAEYQEIVLSQTNDPNRFYR